MLSNDRADIRTASDCYKYLHTSRNPGGVSIRLHKTQHKRRVTYLQLHVGGTQLHISNQQQPITDRRITTHLHQRFPDLCPRQLLATSTSSTFHRLFCPLPSTHVFHRSADSCLTVCDCSIASYLSIIFLPNHWPIGTISRWPLPVSGWPRCTEGRPADSSGDERSCVWTWRHPPGTYAVLPGWRTLQHYDGASQWVDLIHSRGTDASRRNSVCMASTRIMRNYLGKGSKRLAKMPVSVFELSQNEGRVHFPKMRMLVKMHPVWPLTFAVYLRTWN